MVTPANRTSGSMDLPNRPINHDFDVTLDHQGQSPAIKQSFMQRNKQKLFAGFEIIVGSTALAVSAAGLHLGLEAEKKSKEDEKEWSIEEQNKYHSNDEKVTVKVIPIVVRDTRKRSSRE